VARGLDKEEAAVDAGVWNITLPLGGKLLPKVGRVLVLDVLHNRVPATVVVDKIAITGRVNNVEPQTNIVLLDNVRDRLDIGGLADRLVGGEAALRVDEMGRKDGVDQGRLAEAGLSYEPKSIAVRCVCGGLRGRSRDLASLPNSPTQMTLNWKPRLRSFFSI